MKITREKLVDELVNKIGIICREFSDPVARKNKENYITPLPVTTIEMRNILHKIVTGLPVDFFISYSDEITNAIKEYIIKEYILFQAQEDITAEEFPDYLINFIYEIKEDVSAAIEKNNILLLS